MAELMMFPCATENGRREGFKQKPWSTLICFTVLVSVCTLCSAQTFKTFVSNENLASGTSLASSTTMNVAASDAVFACVASGSDTVQASSVTDGAGNSLTFLIAKPLASFGTVELWYKYGATANATATFTVTWPSGVPFRAVGVANFSGLNPAGAVDGSGTTKTATGTAQTATNLTTANATDLLVACFNQGGTSTFAGGSSFNILPTNAGGVSTDFTLAYRAVASTGTYPSGTIQTANPSQQYVNVLAAFKTNATGASMVPRSRVARWR